MSLFCSGRCDVIMRYVMEQLGIEVPKYSKYVQNILQHGVEFFNLF